MEENKELLKETYNYKAKKFLYISLGISIFNLITYLIALGSGMFDFGMIFELITLIITYIAIKKIKNNQSAKKQVIIAMIPIILLLAYDFVILCVNIPVILNELKFYYSSTIFYNFIYFLDLVDLTLVAILVCLNISYRS